MGRFKKWIKPIIKSGELTHWHWKVDHADMLVIGRNVDIGSFCYLNAKNGIVIENNVQIGSHTSIYTESTIDNKAGPVILKKNCKIGAHSVIMPGITIGENAIIGALSFINKDVPANAIYYGIPATVKGVNGKCMMT